MRKEWTKHAENLRKKIDFLLLKSVIYKVKKCNKFDKNCLVF